MDEYRFFRFNGAGIIDAADQGRFVDDNEALDFAHDFAIGEAVEVWRAGRRIAKLPPQHSASAQRREPPAPNAATKWRRQSAT